LFYQLSTLAGRVAHDESRGDERATVCNDNGESNRVTWLHAKLLQTSKNCTNVRISGSRRSCAVLAFLQFGAPLVGAYHDKVVVYFEVWSQLAEFECKEACNLVGMPSRTEKLACLAPHRMLL
jgi:hypothetical protein